MADGEGKEGGRIPCVILPPPVALLVVYLFLMTIMPYCFQVEGLFRHSLSTSRSLSFMYPVFAAIAVVCS